MPTTRARHHLQLVRLAVFTVTVILGLIVATPLVATGQEPTRTNAIAAGQPNTAQASAAAESRPNIFFYNLDDLRDAFPGGIDPLQYMPKTRQWLSGARRFTQSFVADPSCCPSRASMMTGRYPHNNGVRNQQDGPKFDGPHSMACYLRGAGYGTYLAGKFLTTWPKTSLPPCFLHSTVMWGGYNNVDVQVDGVSQKANVYSTTYLGSRGRQYITQALSGGSPFLLYEAPHAPHWSETTNPDGTVSRLAIPATQYTSAPVETCSGVPEADRSDKPAFVRNMNFTTAQAQTFCAAQLRAIMTADDEFAATMQLLSDRGVLANTLVVLSSDNGYMWGEHGRWEKFVPYEPSIRVPLLLRWPGHIAAGVDISRTTSGLDLLPTILEATGITLPAGSPALDGESLLQSSSRTTMYSEYYTDTANPGIPYWRMIRTKTTKYVQYYNAQGGVTFREYYTLSSDPSENTNLLGDASTANDPPASNLRNLTTRLNAFATCSGTSCVQ